MLQTSCCKHNCKVIQFATASLYIQMQLGDPQLDYRVQYSLFYITVFQYTVEAAYYGHFGTRAF